MAQRRPVVGDVDGAVLWKVDLNPVEFEAIVWIDQEAVGTVLPIVIRLVIVLPASPHPIVKRYHLLGWQTCKK